jgi:GNAT superfamily N-acetyltransferase
VREEDLLRRVYEALQGYYELGCEVIDDPRARFVRDRDAPRIYDVNFAHSVRAATEPEIVAVLERADEVFAGLPHRIFHLDPWTPPAFEARLVVEGFAFEDELELLLARDLAIVDEPPPVEIRPVDSDDDWAIVRRLTRLDHEETARRRLHPLWDEDVTTEMVATKRAKAPDLRFWLARADGVDCAFLSSWPGANGVGKVEDLFTHPDFRHRGVATALIVHCVRDARARGAGPVLIGALLNDTPMHMYVAMGFRPFCVAHRGRKSNDT